MENGVNRDLDTLDGIFDAIDVAFSEAYRDTQDRPLGTGPDKHFRGNSAPNLAKHYAASEAAAEVMGPVTWRAHLSPKFFALMSRVKPEDVRAKAVDLAAALVALIEDIDTNKAPEQPPRDGA